VIPALGRLRQEDPEFQAQPEQDGETLFKKKINK
jgi:hypothetical protein